MGIEYAAGGRLRKLSLDEAWATIVRLAQYENEGWNDAFIPVEMSLNYKNPDIEQLLGIIERRRHLTWGSYLPAKLKSAILQLHQYGTPSQTSMGKSFCVNEPVYRELVHEFFASFEFDASPCRYDPNHLGVRFRLGGEQKEISLLELGWRVGLYSKRRSRENATLSGLINGDTIKESRLLMEFWPTIGDRGFNVGNTKVASIRDPRVKLAHRCIETTITG
ncbi:hypothetical protein Tco_0411042 [Tanacetum coccineum]